VGSRDVGRELGGGLVSGVKVRGRHERAKSERTLLRHIRIVFHLIVGGM
jgi:hypothetical protein